MPSRRRATSSTTFVRRGRPPGRASEGRQDLPYPKITEDFSAEDGINLWRSTSARFQDSRDRALESEDLVLGYLTLEPAGQLARDPNSDRLTYKTPQRKELILNIVNSLAEVTPEYTRKAPNDDPVAIERAEQVEDCLNELRRQLVDWDQMIGRSAMHAEQATITAIHETHWEVLPEYNDTLTEKEYQALSSADKKTYTQRGGQYQRPKTQYWRDNQGRSPEQAGYTRRSGARTKAAYEKDVEDTMAAHPPFINRIVSIYDCAPIFATQLDGRRRLHGLCVRTLMDEEPLQQMGLRWDDRTADNKPLLIPRGFDSGNVTGALGKLWFYEFYVWINGDPCILYLVAGQSTWMNDDPEMKPAIINLRKEWGFTRLPITYPLGLNLPVDEPAEKGVPFMEPLTEAILGFEGLITSMNYTAWRRGTSKLMIQPDPSIPSAAYMHSDGNSLKSFVFDDDADVVTLPGPATNLAPAEHSADSKFLIETFGNEVHNATPADPATANPASGRLADLLHTYARSSKRMIPEECRQSVEQIGSYLLEWACCYMRKKGLKRLPIDANVDADPAEGQEREGTQRLYLVEAHIGTNYRITAKWPSQNNPIEVQQEVDLAEKGFGSFDDVQEKRGKTNAMRERIKAINDAYWRSPEGVADLNAYAAKRRGDVAKAKKLDMILQKQLTPDGQGPMSALSPELQGYYFNQPAPAVPQPTAGPPGAPGPSGNAPGEDFGQHSLAGTVGGAYAGAANQARMASAATPTGAQPIPVNGATP